MAVTYRAKALIDGTHTKSFEGQTLTNQLTFTSDNTYTDGTQIDQADLVWIDKARNLNATTEQIDLSGALTDGFGATVVFSKITTVYVRNLNTTAGETLKVGGDANAVLIFDNATDIHTVGPDGCLLIDEPSTAAITVTAGTGDILKMDAGAANINYDICVIGRS